MLSVSHAFLPTLYFRIRVSTVAQLSTTVEPAAKAIVPASHPLLRHLPQLLPHPPLQLEIRLLHLPKKTPASLPMLEIGKLAPHPNKLMHTVTW